MILFLRLRSLACHPAATAPGPLTPKARKTCHTYAKRSGPKVWPGRRRCLPRGAITPISVDPRETAKPTRPDGAHPSEGWRRYAGPPPAPRRAGARQRRESCRLHRAPPPLGERARGGAHAQWVDDGGSSRRRPNGSASRANLRGITGGSGRETGKRPTQGRERGGTGGRGTTRPTVLNHLTASTHGHAADSSERHKGRCDNPTNGPQPL